MECVLELFWLWIWLLCINMIENKYRLNDYLGLTEGWQLHLQVNYAILDKKTVTCRVSSDPPTQSIGVLWSGNDTQQSNIFLQTYMQQLQHIWPTGWQACRRHTMFTDLVMVTWRHGYRNETTNVPIFHPLNTAIPVPPWSLVLH